MFFRKKTQWKQNSSAEWKKQWQSIVPAENRDVPITIGEKTVTAYVQINQFVLMLQDGLLMEQGFFEVCSFFQAAGYHVIWLMRCTQDIHNGYLKEKGSFEGGSRRKWLWKSPTTNFGRWTSDNFHATILLQHELPEGELLESQKRILQRVTWAESDDASRMIPGRTTFQTMDNPGTAEELQRWLQGEALSKIRK